MGAKGVSFRAVRPGNRRACWPYGRGQDDVVSLLMRFYDPQRGRIHARRCRHPGVLAGGRLRSRIGYVQQDIFLFAGDVASNIRLSSHSPTPTSSWPRTRRRRRIIQRLPGGYQYLLGERGASISVGERQLLSFARAIAANPSLLILDEATSAIDSEIEAEIQAAMNS